MINNRDDLRKYLEMDKFAYHTERNRPRFFRDDIWRYLIILRKHEYYVNTGRGLFAKVMKKYYAFRHSWLGRKLGYEIPINTCAGG